jgi:hypothetical protein
MIRVRSSKLSARFWTWTQDWLRGAKEYMEAQAPQSAMIDPRQLSSKRFLLLDDMQLDGRTPTNKTEVQFIWVRRCRCQSSVSRAKVKRGDAQNASAPQAWGIPTWLRWRAACGVRTLVPRGASEERQTSPRIKRQGAPMTQKCQVCKVYSTYVEGQVARASSRVALREALHLSHTQPTGALQSHLLRYLNALHLHAPCSAVGHDATTLSRARSSGVGRSGALLACCCTRSSLRSDCDST